ncbi:MBL fold metallo-hydrolase [Notoacmeibacter ruber]|uniref:MBL fold metallo-hydrolase n=1 Tax=Notoacmeibacter ruber TaxID=2670375 RepID=A0A3L7JAU8_9HYPH|nr:MBL fold metallo-hydrolase [Notoacmeibacter ruber]RLQ87868.1 MBL fold metallo-hydrolase [Notoacmeibacter ruber]
MLGCGSSPGVPRLTGDWGKCDPKQPKNRRLRASALVQRIADDGQMTTVVIDTGPDFREQMISAGVTELHGAVYTHAHADHLHGIDDLRGYWLTQGALVPTYADEATFERIYDGFRYVYETPPDSAYPPILSRNEIQVGVPFQIDGDGGPISFLPLHQEHGSIHSLGFRIGPLAYCTDVSAWPEETVEQLHNLQLLVVDALQYRRHPSHFSLEQAVEWVDYLKPERAVLTHMHTLLDYDTVMAETPGHVEPGFDGLTVELHIDD